MFQININNYKDFSLLKPLDLAIHDLLRALN